MTHLHFLPTALLCAFVAIITSIVMNPVIIKLAFKKHLTDAPNYRKLQKQPVPVLGGMSVYMAFVNGLFFANFFYPTDRLYVVIAALSLMFFLGLFDDLIDLSYKLKFVVQFGVIFMLWVFGYRIDTLAGLFGVTEIPMVWSCLLSLFAGVGLINALNMVDGVDGLASGLGILSSSICGTYFIAHHDPLFALLSIVFAGALVPFFVCNVFSRKYKMFIGDSGSLIMGALAYVFTCRIIHAPILDWNDQYCVAMLFAIYALPVFDTVRVMLLRMYNKKSPFHADRTHLHHMFVNLGFPHIMITTILLFLNCVVIAVWYITSVLMESVNGQFFVTVGVAILLVQGLYFTLNRVLRVNPQRFARYQAASRVMSRRPITIRNNIRELIDGHVRRRYKAQRAKRKQQRRESKGLPTDS